MTRSLALALAASLLLAAPALAAKPQAASIAPNETALRLGSAVTFTTTYPKATHNPWISLTCFQGDVLVYGEGGKPDHTFVLGGASSEWLQRGGPATCYAELGDLYWRGGHEFYVYLAAVSFDA